MTKPLRSLIYVSTSNVAPRSVDAVAIDHDARRRNAAHGITGYLHHEGATFLQYIEGRPDRIETLLANLRRDWRHTDLTVVLDRPIATRLFEEWGMGFTDAETRPYPAGGPEAGGLTALRRATAEELLAFVRGAARSGPGRDLFRGGRDPIPEPRGQV